MEPTSAASLYQIGVRSTSLIPAAPSRSTVPRWATVAQRLGDRLGRSDRLDHVGEATHQHDVGLAADDPRPDEVGQLLEMAIVGFGPHHVIRPAQGRRRSLMGVPGQHRHRGTREEPLERSHRGQADDAGADHQHGIAVGGSGAQRP
jgi:hypothetical protein